MNDEYEIDDMFEKRPIIAALTRLEEKDLQLSVKAFRRYPGSQENPGPFALHIWLSQFQTDQISGSGCVKSF